VRFNQVDGEHVVATAGTDRPRALVLGMLNIIPHAGWSGFTRVAGQIGIGISSKAPAIATGLGIRFAQPSRMVFSIGAVFPFVQELEGIALGEKVAGEASLDSFIKWRLSSRPSLYVGVQR
jgi:hypothetical protein